MSEKEKIYCSNCKEQSDDIELKLCVKCQNKYFEDLKDDNE